MASYHDKKLIFTGATNNLQMNKITLNSMNPELHFRLRKIIKVVNIGKIDPGFRAFSVNAKHESKLGKG